MKIPFKNQIDKVLERRSKVVMYTVSGHGADLPKVFRQFRKHVEWHYGCALPLDYCWWDLSFGRALLISAAPETLKMFEQFIEHSKSSGWISDYKEVIKKGQQYKTFKKTLAHYISCYIHTPYELCWGATRKE
jgi:hypothetical protein